MFKVIQRILQDKMATEPVCLTGSERFRGRLDGECPEPLLTTCASACPVQAFHPDEAAAAGYRIDYRRCLFCGRCVEAATQAVTEAEGRLHHSSAEVMPFLVESAQEATAAVIRQKLGRSLHVRHLDAGSCNACDFEMGAMSNPVYDLHRYGIHFAASPRHADLLMVTGTVTRNLEQALKMTYEAMPEPRLVMACGACAAGGETYGSSYAIVGAADKVVPVDLYVPGCPPRPSAMIAGLLAAADMLAAKL